ncbi:FAD/NAD(P)-binding protein [Neorhodopirellula pilleata]|uniref:FAD-dependent urate hydroxylase HpyO/Asp monooxygenase CreE-like FAD/NAD(P)-binding domain-containing protein n=1 Tax=Neorhodopirellula pilleata TaxID=2714738 RepID=A0A5C6ARL9_9BACT|nr:FAD/NAD(P)-binding protein [Neorhodopirellula pilleata]TWU01726.1 hypothetical protein Pla100_14610 [Neorhodopirellula pilleata]
MPDRPRRLAIIGSGPTALYLLHHLTQHLDQFSRDLRHVDVFERSDQMGVGMPYSAETTDRFNLCNISSEELPPLDEEFADWLRACDDERLSDWAIDRANISEDETYCRLALGQYFQDQWKHSVTRLRKSGIEVTEHCPTQVVDIVDRNAENELTIVTDNGEQFTVDRVVVATGHQFADEDQPDAGYFASPWPMHKLIPGNDQYYNFTIGTLGASLSAFDVIASLAHRHGRFIRTEDRYEFILETEAKGFRIVMHSAQGWLPHLQYEQREPFREIYRHTTREQILGLRNDDGFLTLDTYFDQVCRPALVKAFTRDKRNDIVDALGQADFDMDDFVERMSGEHDYDDAFAGMRSELPEARISVEHDRPVHWKEVIDDLMYTLSYHAELMSAEDHLRLHGVVMPFLMNVIAALPLQSAKTLLALHDAGCLELVTGRVKVTGHERGETQIEVADGDDVTESSYRMFVDCSGQSPLKVHDYPFDSLVQDKRIRSARVAFADVNSVPELDDDKRDRVIDGETAALELAGIDIDSVYRVIGDDGVANTRIHDIAFPNTIGKRPYSYGLQACSETAAIVVEAWRREMHENIGQSGSIESPSKIYQETSGTTNRVEH